MKTFDRDALGRALAATCKSLRERAEIAQEDFAYEAGMERAQVSLIERGRGNPTLVTMFKMLPPFKVDFPAFAAELDANLRKRPAKGAQ